MTEAAPAKILKCPLLLTDSGWLSDVFVHLDSRGVIAKKTSVAESGCAVEELPGPVIPGFQNAHSHAFQYAMAGLAEHLPMDRAQDDFWSWRETMYDLALKISPDDMERVAAMLYGEMLRWGITGVAEFHYLHHDRTGAPYANLTEMGERLAAAAESAGINLTLIPVFYQKGGFDKPAESHQRRFLSRDHESYLKLLDATVSATRELQHVNVGAGIHSLRAVHKDEIIEVAKDSAGQVIHIHIAEQQKEVNECLAHLGQRPVAWLYDHLKVDEYFNLVHATHVTEKETLLIAKSGAVAVLCPSTEGNLGDGFFPIRRFLELGGTFAIGTDSHISLSPMEDLRWLDYGARLKAEKRARFCLRGGHDSGMEAVQHSWAGGRRARGDLTSGPFAAGSTFDAVVLDSDHPVLLGKPTSCIFSSFIYSGDASAIKGTLRAGRWIVKDGQHERKDSLKKNFRQAMSRLMGII